MTLVKYQLKNNFSEITPVYSGVFLLKKFYPTIYIFILILILILGHYIPLRVMLLESLLLYQRFNTKKVRNFISKNGNKKRLKFHEDSTKIPQRFHGSALCNVTQLEFYQMGIFMEKTIQIKND